MELKQVAKDYCWFVKNSPTFMEGTMNKKRIFVKSLQYGFKFAKEMKKSRNMEV